MAIDSYLDKPLLFKIQKILRYVEMYGPSRTLIKVRGQLHMARTDGFDGSRWRNPACGTPDGPHRNIGVVGSGSFAFTNIAYYLQQIQHDCIRAAMDIDAARAKSLVRHYGAAYATTDIEEIVNDPAIRLVFIASNHASHTPYAIKALDAGKHVHIEKPHVVSEQQLRDLVAAMDRNPNGRVFLGFNRPRSPLFGRLHQAFDSEPGPSMINWFIAGHAIEDGHWYFSEDEGGRILGNLCHWTDLSLQLVGVDNAFPCRVVPASAPGAKSDFITTFEFADSSMATLSFSAKGHTFDGVRETLNAHKGELLVELKDFASLTLNRGAQRSVVKPLFREHGHKKNIENSYSVATEGAPGVAANKRYLVATARLFLATREAHRQRTPVEVDLRDFDPS